MRQDEQSGAAPAAAVVKSAKELALEAGCTEKEVKAAFKEGGKKGQDLAGLKDLGGIKHFCVAMEKCLGKVELLKVAMEGMNAEVADGAEERKGGAANIGKMLMSAGEKAVYVVGNVPPEAAVGAPIKDWATVIAEAMSGTVVSCTDTDVVIEAKGDSGKGLYPLKMRDVGINSSFAWLKKSGLVPEDDSSDDDVNLAEEAGIEW